MPIINQIDWDNQVKNNDDPYGKACVDVARRVMEILDGDNPQGVLDTHALICRADKEAAGGITGFMSGCVAQMVAHCHSRGNEFRMAFNGEHGISEKEAGGSIINPALMTVKVKEK